MKKAEKKLLTILESIEGNGNFYYSGINKIVVPGLTIEGVGEVALPVNPIVTREIIKHSKKSPVGKGSQTIHDLSVRSSWEIETNKISFKNKEWDDYIEKVVTQVKKGLGITGKTITASLHKFLIYEKDDFFVTHKDSEKEAGMFGTLVINLPSEHTGGEFSVRFKGKEKKLDFSKNTYKLPYVAFFADCDHQVKPVHSGYRINLVYNLLYSGKSKIESPVYDSKIPEVAEILKKMANEKSDILYKVIRLEHEYTPTNFSKENLKLNDLPRSKVLLEAAEKAGYYAKLGLITHYKMGELEVDDYNYGRRGRYDDYDDEPEAEEGEMGEVYEEYTNVEHWIGEEIPDLGKIDIDETHFLNDFLLGEGEPSQEESEGFTGNAGMTVEYWYYYGAVILWKKNKQAELLKELPAATKLKWLKYYLKNWNDKKIEAQKNAKNILIDIHEKKEYPELDYSIITTAIEKINDKNFVVKYCIDTLIAVFDKIEINNWFHLLEENNYNDILNSIFQTVGYTGDVDKINHLFKFLQKTDFINAAQNSLTHTQIEQIPNYVANIKFEQLQNSYNFTRRELPERKETIINIITLITEFSKTKANDEKWLNEVVAQITKNMKREYVNTVLAKILLNSSKKTLIFDKLYAICLPYFTERVNNKPQQLPNWKRKVPKSSNTYRQTIWDMLKSFLESPTQQVFEYRKAQSYRSDVENAIKSVIIDLKKATIKKGSPHTLRLTKTNAAYERELKKWKEDEKLLKKIKSL